LHKKEIYLETVNGLQFAKTLYGDMVDI